MSGIPLMGELDPMSATTRGLGEVVRAAVESGMSQIWIGLGGSASTDGGIGALRALGLRALDARGEEIPRRRQRAAARARVGRYTGPMKTGSSRLRV